jgi:hypothetical protein
MTSFIPTFVPELDLRKWIKANPFSKETLKEISTSEFVDRHADKDREVKFGFAIYPLDPRATLSRILFSLNTEFRAAGLSVKTTILRQEVVKLCEKVGELNGRKHPKKKILEALSSPVPGHWDVLDQAMATIYDVQLIFVNEEAKKISFAPHDLRTWSADKEVLIMESNGAEAWEWEQGKLGMKRALEFIEELEDLGWKIVWPEADGTLKAMEERAEEISVSSVDSNGKKLKKEILGLRLGRAEAIRNLACA